MISIGFSPGLHRFFPTRWCFFAPGGEDEDADGLRRPGWVVGHSGAAAAGGRRLVADWTMGFDEMGWDRMRWGEMRWDGEIEHFSHIHIHPYFIHIYIYHISYIHNLFAALWHFTKWMAKGDRYPGPHFWEGWAGEMMEDDFRCIFDPLGRYRPYIYMYICERAKAPITLAAPTENLPSPARNGNLRLKAKMKFT